MLFGAFSLAGPWMWGPIAQTGESAELLIMLSSPWILIPVFAFGASVGSFLNVVMIRLPRGESIVSPPSHCMTCGAAIPWYDNIPVLSYFILRGRCRSCKTRFSPTYMIIELLVGLLAVACFLHARSDAPWLHLSRFVAEFTFVSVLVALAGIDGKTWILPNKILLPAIPIFWSLAVLTKTLSWSDALIGAVAGFGVLALVIVGYGLLTGRLGMGWGDAKLMAALGAFLGWQGLPLVILLGSFQGLAAALVLLGLGRTSKPSEKYQPLEKGQAPAAGGTSADGADEGDGPDRPTQTDEDQQLMDQLSNPDSWRHVALPFGPFLVLAAIEVLFFKDAILNWWLS